MRLVHFLHNTRVFSRCFTNLIPVPRII